jgi:UDP-N-acetylglucosamine--N-acetylmuramyl-(pentapeptide) pyrophosphoryl-undecaprenol N-acetylglucosamine transferase
VSAQRTQGAEAPDRIVLAAGGTGGHMFPAAALADELGCRGFLPILITDARGGGYGEAPGRIETHRIRAGKVAGLGPLARLSGLLSIALGTLQARRLLRKLHPAAVVGFGGYASFPTVLAATWLGLPTLIHEQNAVLGRANRMLAPRVTAIATSFDTVARLRPSDRAKTVRTGNPVREAVVETARAPYPAIEPGGPLRLLVLGGSQGATVFSRVVPPAVARLTPDKRGRLEIAQQCRPEDLEQVRQAFDEIGVAAEIAPFFDDVPERLSSVHLVIGRAGAGAVAELTVTGRPALLVPYPRAIDDHQTANARAIDDAGGAWLIPEESFTADALAVRLESFLEVPEILNQTAERARALGRPDAARRLADAIETRVLANADGKPAGGSNPSSREAAA